MNFLVRIEFDLPATMPTQEVDRLKAAESIRAAELAVDGRLLRLWRDPERWANWGLWDAQDQDDLFRHLATLPLYPYMSVAPHAVVPHPSDPLTQQERL